jgi:hypothetical protein
VARLATTKIGERHVACRGGCSSLPRARALSRAALSEAVVVGGVGTTSMARSEHDSLNGMRARQRGHVSMWPLRCQGVRHALGSGLLLLIESIDLQTIPLHL